MSFNNARSAGIREINESPQTGIREIPDPRRVRGFVKSRPRRRRRGFLYYVKGKGARCAAPSPSLRKLRGTARHMQPPIKATLPYPPTVNHYWLRTKRGMRISDEGRDFRRRVVALLAGCPTFTGRLAVTVRVFPPDRRTRDQSNLSKALFDALEHAGLFANDNQIVEEHWYRRAPTPPGHVEVTIAEAPA